MFLTTKQYILVVFLITCVALPALAVTYGVQTKTAHCVANQTLPDPACTPGAVLTTDTSTICATGYTKTVRDVSLATKKKVFKEYGIPWAQRNNYEVDHLISLELGGSNDISNLFPESYLILSGARIKDNFENYLHKQVCSGAIIIQEAQWGISTDWLQYATQHTVNQNGRGLIHMLFLPKSLPLENPAPSASIPTSNPAGATAQCKDGTFSFSQSRSGTCSHHGGVSQWLY